MGKEVRVPFSIPFLHKRFPILLNLVMHLKDGSIIWVLVAHSCNPSYSGGRDQEDHGLKPALANSL
jgi:hypothetical protein